MRLLKPDTLAFAAITLVAAVALLSSDPANAARRRLVNSVGSGSGVFIYPSEFEAYVDTMYTRGFRTVRVGGQWGQKCYQCAPDTIEYDAEPSPGVYDFSVYFDRLDHAITIKGMKAVVSFNLGGRLDTDPVSPGSQPVLPSFLAASDVMLYRNGAGQDQIFSSGFTKVPRFEKPTVRAAMLSFISELVSQFHARYGDNILYYSFSFSQYGENEYPLIGYPGIADTSPEAAAAFRSWLQQHYATPAAVAAAWGHVPPFASWTEIQILDGQPPPATGSAPRAYLDFAAYREAALGKFLAEARDRVHVAGGKVMAQYGSVWDSYSSVRGTLGFGSQIAGYDLVLVDDAPEYDHEFSMDYTRTNSPGVPFGNEVDAPCRFGCTSDINTCCYAPTFPDFIDVPAGITLMNSQIDETYERGAIWLDFANWDNFYTEAFTLFAAPLANAVALAMQQTTAPVATDTLHLSLTDLYAHHHDDAYLSSVIAAHHALGGATTPIAVRVANDLAPPVLLGIGPARPRTRVSLSSPEPNPARGPFTLVYTLERREPVRLRVFDLVGREVADLPQGTLDAGAHRVQLDSRLLASGVYLFRLETASAVLARKFQVVR